MTPEQKQFVDRVSVLAVADMKKSGILASLTIAQAILESGWGKSALTREKNNLFGIKGKGAKFKTFEYINGKRVDITDSFKVYPDWETSVTDHSALFHRLSRYHNLIGETDYKEACKKVFADGYATAPNYTQALISLIEQYRLYEYDVTSFTTYHKLCTELAVRVLENEFGNGDERKNNLGAIYSDVQKIVNKLVEERK